NPNANSHVSTLTVSGSTVYVGGGFTTIGGQSRNFLAALDTTSGNATAWNPNANSQVSTIAVSGSIVYVGGNFSTVGGQSRNYLAALDATSGNATAWNPNANNQVGIIAVVGSTVYVGGNFTTIGSQSRRSIASLDSITGIATAWNPETSGVPMTLAVSGSMLYVGGNFVSIGGKARSNLAAFDTYTGEFTEWDPVSSGDVYTLVFDDSKVYIGGDFFNIGGQSRYRIAAVETPTGTVTAWNPSANNSVFSIAVNGSTVYAGGNFTTIGGQSRNYLAALDATSGNATVWDPNANSWVNTITIDGSTVYAGGNFTTIGGQSRNYLAALDATSGNATAWDPNANSSVTSVAVSDSMLYVCGAFKAFQNNLLYRPSFARFNDDSTAPVISLTALSPDPTTDPSPTFWGTATDDLNTVTLVEFQIDSTSGSWTTCVSDDGTFDEASEIFTCDVSALTDGSHKIYVRATDSTGNTTGSGSEATDTFTVDTTVEGKTISIGGKLIEEGKDNAEIGNKKPEFRGSGEPEALVTIVLSGDGIVVIGRTAVGEDGSWAWKPNEALPNGEYTVIITYEDRVGNTREEKFTLIIKAGSIDTTETELADSGGNSRYMIIYGLILITFSLGIYRQDTSVIMIKL
ncbi:hypothetical protein KJ918_01020, partial [Patescibacteria group bacterium]|nr:hypothetical protein [Patescibacteria group bacterium]